jgi:hypothetical protein
VLLQFPSISHLPHFERLYSCLHFIIFSCINDVCVCLCVCACVSACTRIRMHTLVYILSLASTFD